MRLMSRSSMSSGCAIGLSIDGPSPVTNSSFRPIGSTGSRRSAKMMAASDVKNFNRLECNFGREFGFFADFENRVFGPNIPVWLHVQRPA